jgi:hypothetical protein
VWVHALPGSVNGWLSIAGDLVVVPIGGTSPPEVLALRLPTGTK